jgi:GT2 family glycosyltransferase
MLIRRHALDEVGRFDEGYWLYMEDLDLCWRFARASWVTWYEPSVAATREGRDEWRHRRLRANHAFHRGCALYRLHYASSRPRALNAAVYGAIAQARRLRGAEAQPPAPEAHDHDDPGSRGAVPRPAEADADAHDRAGHGRARRHVRARTSAAKRACSTG